ncbi:ABC transporter substrate-binding protein [Longispora fulva]|uniref:Multiple sugar transport system substrate-binding protein n=1 Tax=Longispora fulva TaxID=619741 RepID=A0A8J7KWB9_9ACTN|nr:extracellular solute-binding protein [Longispora fulva]MBG6136367.1 multiple sugar transport system substrate-binding protein [Longispora fulva]GIG63459.1 ABC transporter substrate-binding protein [Longispora fulva]
MKPRTASARAWRIARPAAVGALALVLAGLIGGCGAADAPTKDDPNAELLVWTDATRQAGFEQFKKSHPDVKMKVETYDSAALLTKIQLFNRTGKGWPDVIFDATPNEVAALSSKLFDYAQPLNDLIPQDVQANFGSANAGCHVDGKLYCLKNDLAQSVLWYDKTLMDQFGYKVPSTWTEYAKLGQQVAKDHPGYIIGTAGFKFVYYDYFWSSGCPLQTVTAPQTVKIDTKDVKCTRVTDLLDPLISAGVVSRGGPFDPEVTKLGKDKKILMMPGASWYGDFVFKPEASYALPNGRLAAAAYPKWDGEDKAWSGATGGGIYLVSKHSANKKGAAAIAQWMATDTDLQASAPTYPAYGPAADAWGAKHGTDPFYATNPLPALKAQAALINPAEANTSYGVEDAITGTVVAKVRGGGKLADGLPDLQSQLQQLAQSVGYAVN